jgi:hypothetical protein
MNTPGSIGGFMVNSSALCGEPMQTASHKLTRMRWLIYQHEILEALAQPTASFSEKRRAEFPGKIECPLPTP